MPEPILQVRGLRFFGLGPFDFMMSVGESVSLSGPSGQGKSQFLRSLVDLFDSSGEVHFQGTNLQEIPPIQLRKQIGYLPSQSAWWEDLVSPHFREPDRVDLLSLGLPKEVMSWEVQRLSSGEKQRLAYLRLLENQPKLLLLDEPTASLDPKNVQLLERHVQAYLKAHHASLIWVSHDPAQARRMATRHLQFSPAGIIDGIYELSLKDLP